MLHRVSILALILALGFLEAKVQIKTEVQGGFLNRMRKLH